MAKGTCFLVMDEERNFTIQLVTASQVADIDLYNIIEEQNPLLAKLMMDQFKAFLVNEYFTAIERQSVLMNFLNEGQRVKRVQEIREHINKTEFKKDYDAIFMEWTFHHSSDLIEAALEKYDGVGLNLTKAEQYRRLQQTQEEKIEELPDEIIKTLASILMNEVNDLKDEEDG